MRVRVRHGVAVAALIAVAACSGGDTVAYDGPHARSVRRSMPIIERTTGRKFLESPRLQERSRDELREFLERAFNEQLPPLELAGIEASYKRFGLIPDSLDLRTLMIRLLDEQVVGYFDPRENTLFVMRDAPPEILGGTITHELVHALQHQHFPLDSIERIRTSNDRRTAAQAVAEGQAVWEQLVVMTGVANPANAMPGGWDGMRQRIREEQTNMPLLNNAPTILREVLLFPYLSGAEFVRQFKARQGKAWPFDSLPQSTEQVMHPEKFFEERDVPTTVTLPPLRGGGGGRIVYENDLGEFETRILVYEHTRDQNLAVRAAAGWDGDRYALLAFPGGGEGIVWATVWDSTVDAAEFLDALEQAFPRRYSGLAPRPASGNVRRFGGAGRSVEIRGVTVDGRPVVILVDVPAGVSTDLVDPVRIGLTQ